MNTRRGRLGAFKAVSQVIDGGGQRMNGGRQVGYACRAPHNCNLHIVVVLIVVLCCFDIKKGVPGLFAGQCDKCEDNGLLTTYLVEILGRISPWSSPDSRSTNEFWGLANE